MKILVTGASGFIGLALVKSLSLVKHFEVVGLVRSTKNRLDNPNIEYRLGELGRTPDTKLDLTDIDIIVHTAGRAHVMKEDTLNAVEEFRRVNTKATLDLARSASESGVKRFIFLSSIKVNGDRTTLGSPFSSTSEAKPKDAYGVSKYEAEKGLRKISKDKNLEVVIIRPPLVYGPGVKGNFNTILKFMSSGIPLPLASIKKNKRSMVSLANLISLIIKCCDHPNAKNKTFLVSDNSDVSTAELFRKVGDVVGRPARLFHCPERLLLFIAKLFGKNDKVQRVLGTLQVDISQTCRELDWQPPQQLEDGLKELI
jgi:nucleoside-diphosphate-sugar epimerase